MSRKDSAYHGLNIGGGSVTRAGRDASGATSWASAGRVTEPASRIKAPKTAGATTTVKRTPMTHSCIPGVRTRPTIRDHSSLTAKGLGTRSAQPVFCTGAEWFAKAIGFDKGHYRQLYGLVAWRRRRSVLPLSG